VRHVKPLDESFFSGELSNETKRKNASLAYSVALKLGIPDQKIIQKISHLPELALRMETYEGKNGNFIINDLYNLDADAFRSSLEFQKSVAKTKKRAVILGLQQSQLGKKEELAKLVNEFQPDFFYILEENQPFTAELSDT